MTATNRRTTFSFHPSAFPKAFSCEVTHHRAEKATGEWNYSMGDPGVPEHCKFEGLNIGTESVTQWADDNLLLDREALEQEAMDNLPAHLKERDADFYRD